MVFRLSVVPGRLTGEDLLNDRLLRHLVVEDACWKLAHDAWRLSRPPWWRRGHRRRWRSDGVTVEADRWRIAALAWRCGVPS
jgi:hypothetical protein